MGFKRPIMIAGGTIGAVAAVLGYHPAQSSTGLLTQDAPLGSSSTSNQQGAATSTSTTSASATTTTQTPSAAPSASGSSASSSASATKSGSKKNKTQQSSTNSGTATNATAGSTQPTPAPSSSQTQSPVQTTESPSPTPSPTKTTSASQTITGPVISTRWGPVQVEIVFENGQIVSASGLQYPHSDRRSSYISQQAIPMLVDLTLQAQSADGIPRIGGATYTSNGWKSSLAAALNNI
ncbi:unannotated protein [freshwater metagenome]|uniref:Unannotated protein n=1 Tax=freshwater metagenome TaxID=449393 RepID=A0A6J7U5X3_9ZZZZ|nr:FMN-binding protein [Actinomycetota bacterium]